MPSGSVGPMTGKSVIHRMYAKSVSHKARRVDCENITSVYYEAVSNTYEACHTCMFRRETTFV